MRLPEETAKVYLNEYDVYVKKFLTYADIQQIVNSTLQLARTKNEDGVISDSWAVRKQNIDMIMLICATDIPVEELEKISHAVLLSSGLIDAVKKSIVNYNQIEEAFKYSESWDKTLIYGLQQISKQMQTKDFANKLKEVLNGGKSENGTTSEAMASTKD